MTEGQSETNFVKKVMTPYFAGSCILIPITVITKTDHRHGKTYKGGVANYNQIRNTLIKTLASSSKSKNSFVTTMFDFYRLPADVPGVTEAEKINDPYRKVEFIEREILKAESCNGDFFFPYIELHEFEAMLFADVERLEEAYFEYDLTHSHDNHVGGNDHLPEAVGQGLHHHHGQGKDGLCQTRRQPQPDNSENILLVRP